MAPDNNLHKFDPDRFRVANEQFADPLVDTVPVDEVIKAENCRVGGRFAIVPTIAAKYFPPKSRLLLLLATVRRVEREDEPGGWYKLTTGRAADYGLTDRSTRSQTIFALERDGVIEVRRSPGKSPLIRLSNQAQGDFLQTRVPRRLSKQRPSKYEEHQPSQIPPPRTTTATRGHLARTTKSLGRK